PGDPLRRAALVHMEVSGVGADHGLVRAGHGLEREHVGPGPVGHRERLGGLAEVAAEGGQGPGGVGVVAIGRDVAAVRRLQRCDHLRVGAGGVVAGETAGIRLRVRHGWSDIRCPFIFAPASETRNAIASAMCSAGVKVGYSMSGFASRIWGVRIALTTRTFAVAAVPAKESARASVQLSAAALAAA